MFAIHSLELLNWENESSRRYAYDPEEGRYYS